MKNVKFKFNGQEFNTKDLNVFEYLEMSKEKFNANKLMKDIHKSKALNHGNSVVYCSNPKILNALFNTINLEATNGNISEVGYCVSYAGTDIIEIESDKSIIIIGNKENNFDTQNFVIIYKLEEV